MNRVVKVAIIKDNKVLLVKEKGKEHWSLPGGKRQPRERYRACLRREVKEEISGARLREVKYYRSFRYNGRAFRLYTAEGEDDYTPSREIDCLMWTSWPDRYRLSDITRKAIIGLLEDRIIDPSLN